MTRHYLALRSAPDPLYLEGDAKPNPEPRLQFPLVGSVEQMVPTWDAGAGRYYPGEEVDITFGTRDSLGRVDLRLPLAHVVLVDAIQALRDTNEQLIWSPDDGATQWAVKFLPGQDSFNPVPEEFFPGWFPNLVLKLKILERVV